MHTRWSKQFWELGADPRQDEMIGGVGYGELGVAFCSTQDVANGIGCGKLVGEGMAHQDGANYVGELVGVAVDHTQDGAC